MSRRASPTVCKSKQIPRIFQRNRNQIIRGVGRGGWSFLDGVNIEANTSIACELQSADARQIEKSQKHSPGIDCSSKISPNCPSSSEPVSTFEKSAGGSVDDIEKWLKTRTESVSCIDLDTMKSVVEDEENVGVDRYLADELPHVFLEKDPDGLSIDIDLSDKKLSLDYEPLLREMQSDKLLEACEKNDDFILPEFRLDNLDPLTLSPHDMMVAGEILPSASQPSPSTNSRRDKEMPNESPLETQMGELMGKPVQVYGLTEGLEMAKEHIFHKDVCQGTEEDMCRSVAAQKQPTAVLDNNENNKSNSKIGPHRRKIRPKPQRNDITFLNESCRVDAKEGAMAVVAISTDKISNMTQIVINTGMDEQIYQGKTSELIEATGNFPKISKIDIDNGAFAERNRPHERVVSKALEELGITDESLEPALITETGRTWLCPRDECNREFCKLHALKAHLLAHYGVRPFKCDHKGCTWAFHSEFKLKRHKETHLKRKNFVCEVPGCNRRFTTVYNLWSHEKLHTRPNRIVCSVPECQEKFQTKRSLELHMKIHDQSHAPYRCNHEGCGKRYYTSNALTSHQRCHNYKEIDVKCSWPGCEKIFDKPCRLKAHVRSHTGSKPYTCTYQDCQWAFSSSSKLKRHEKKHTNERKFACNVEGCGKAFMRSEHLREHLLTHAGGGYFQCYMCDAHFSAKSSLYVHIKKHQIKEAVETITDGAGMISNLQGQKEQEISEETEQVQAFEIEPSLSHAETNGSREISRKSSKKDRLSYSCGILGCGKNFRSLSNLGNHMIANHGNSMEECDKAFNGISVSTETDLDYIMYTTADSTSGIANRTMLLESCDTIILSESPKNICLPEPEPPPTADENSKQQRISSRSQAEKHILDGRSKKSCQGSARTGLTCDDVWKLKTKVNGTETVIVGASDVVLGTANLGEGLLLTEELPSMYYQDDMVGTECQILLLDTGSTENPIDLRGLV